MTQWTKTGSNLNLSHKLCMHEVALIDESSCLSFQSGDDECENCSLRTNLNTRRQAVRWEGSAYLESIASNIGLHVSETPRHNDTGNATIKFGRRQALCQHSLITLLIWSELSLIQWWGV